MNTNYLKFLEYVAQSKVDFNTDLYESLSKTIKKKLIRYYGLNSITVEFSNGQLIYSDLLFKNAKLFSQDYSNIVLFDFTDESTEISQSMNNTELYNFVLESAKETIKDYVAELDTLKLPSLVAFEFFNGTKNNFGKDFLQVPNLNQFTNITALTKNRLRQLAEQLNEDAKNVHIYKRLYLGLNGTANLDLQANKIILTEDVPKREIKELMTKVQEYVLEYNYFINTTKIDKLIQTDIVNKKFIIDLPESKSLKFSIEEAQYFVTDLNTSYLKLRIFYGNVKPRFVFVKISNNRAEKITHTKFNKEMYFFEFDLTIKHENNQYILYKD